GGEEGGGDGGGRRGREAGGLEPAGGVRGGRPAAEVPAADHEVAGLDPPGELGVEVFQAVGGQGRDVLGEEPVAPAGDVVGADVVAEPVDQAGLRHEPSTSRGSPIRPATAAAATATGGARAMPAVGLRSRPRKLRFIEALPTSPSLGTPNPIPGQGPQPGGPRTAPASRKVWRMPSAMASSRTCRDAGIKRRRTPGWTRWPRSARAA